MKSKDKYVLYKAQDGSPTIKEWREDERPREKLLLKGAKSLSDAELIAILLGSGTKGISAVDVARNLLMKFGELSKLAYRDLSEYHTIKGVGKTKAVKLAAAFEISKRARAEDYLSKKIIRGPEDIASIYIPRFMGKMNEAFMVLLLNASNQIIREVVVSEGILNSSLVHPREVFRMAITEMSAAVFLLHNHPSGNTEPSREDINITRRLVEAGKTIDIKVIDHLIIAGENYTSFAEMGLL